MNNHANISPTTIQASPTVLPSNPTQKPADHSYLNLNVDDAPTSSVSTGGRTTVTGTPSRKPPHCSICKRPRKGHPRSGCSFSKLSSSKIETEHPSESTLTEALGTAAKEYHDTKAAVSEPQNLQLVEQNNTPLTLNANSKESVEGVNSDPEFAAAVVTSPRLALETTVKDQMSVPNSLPDSTPLPPGSNLTSFSIDSSFTSKQTLPTCSARILHSDRPAEFENKYNSDPVLPPNHMSESFPPTPSVERDFLLSKLSEKALTAFYIIPKIDAEAIAAEAVALKLNAKLVMSQNDNDPNALIILGHEEKTLRNLLPAAITSENVKEQAGKLRGSITLRTSAAAVVVGAIGAWAALAFA